MFSSCLSCPWFQLKFQKKNNSQGFTLSLSHQKIPKALLSDGETCGLASCRNNRRSSPLALQIWRRQLDGRGFPMMKFPHLPYIYMAETKILCQRYQLHIVYTPFLHFWGSLCHYFVISVYSNHNGI